MNTALRLIKTNFNPYIYTPFLFDPDPPFADRGHFLFPIRNLYLFLGEFSQNESFYDFFGNIDSWKNIMKNESPMGGYSLCSC